MHEKMVEISPIANFVTMFLLPAYTNVLPMLKRLAYIFGPVRRRKVTLPGANRLHLGRA